MKLILEVSLIILEINFIRTIDFDILWNEIVSIVVISFIDGIDIGIYRWRIKTDIEILEYNRNINKI